MLGPKVWYHFLMHSDAFPEGAVIEALTGAGLHLYPRASGSVVARDSPGILFFDELDAEVYDFLREASGAGVERVMAVTFNRAVLAGGGAWRVLRAGASDAFAWAHSRAPATEIAARFERWEAVDTLVDSALVKNNLAGESAVWRAVLRQVVEVARFTDASVLVTGESGTGKELAARLIHTLDMRPDKGELIILDCSTVMPELSGSEFFGHERGSYTGAVSSRDGAFALANRGTLFLDEVGELSPRLQAELLRVVQEHKYKRVGGNTWLETNFRLVCATNRNLQQEEADGHFRTDFYHRIAGWTCTLPPLRERVGDVPLLVNCFLRSLCTSQEEPPELDEAVRDYLLRREYRGNVRELKALVSRIARRHVGPGPVTVGDIAEDERPASGDAATDAWCDENFERAIRRALSLGFGLKDIGCAAAETAIRVAVGDEDGNLQRAARKLGVTDRALQMRRAVRRVDQP
jgi:transcriptional regulator with GAF, ATPase, and Fis domain